MEGKPTGFVCALGFSSGSRGTRDSFTCFDCLIVSSLFTITDYVHSLPGAPRALPLRPVLNGCRQEEKLTKDRRPDFGWGGRARGSSGLQTTSHGPLARPPPILEEEEEAEQTSFE